MFTFLRCGRWLACMAAMAMMASPLLAIEPGNAQASHVFDVTISNDGNLVGQVLTSAGQPKANSPVSLFVKTAAVSETKTDARGIFQLPVRSSGVYRIAVADRAFTVRAWEANMAPPAARDSLLCVTQQAVRGQYYGDPSCGAAPCGPPACGVAAPCGPAAGGFGAGGGLMSILTNPVVIGLGVATAIALPLALDDDDDDDFGGGNAGTGGSGEPAS